MEFTKEMIAQAKNAESAEALQALAKENGIAMTQDEAKDYFDRLHKEGALSDEELENVTGGGCFSRDPNEPKYIRNDHNQRCEHWVCRTDGNHRWHEATLGGLACNACHKGAYCFSCFHARPKPGKKSLYCYYGISEY